jgi:uncharacterized protein
MVNEELINLLKKESLLFDSPIHGFYHWQTVERNGLYLSQFSGADSKVVVYFAYFHDCMRENENTDPKHGPRGAEFAKLHQNILGLTNSQLDKLCLACSSHTYGHQSNCPTITTCWDADRLDIGRVGVIPNSKYLFNAEAKRISDQGDRKSLYEFGQKIRTTKL